MITANAYANKANFTVSKSRIGELSHNGRVVPSVTFLRLGNSKGKVAYCSPSTVPEKIKKLN